MLYNLSEEQIRSLCRNSIENLEKWARFIIDRELTLNYGKNYFYFEENGESLIKNEIKNKTQKMMENEKERFAREIDTLFLDETIHILCHPKLYKKCFKKCLDYKYPEGVAEVRTFLSRLIPIRNCLSHGNPISIREAEMAVCYSNDFVEGVKEYMKDIGENNKYNVPNIIRINDSLGNEFYLKNDSYCELVDLKKGNDMYQFNCGERYSIWLTMDSSFNENDYTIEWEIIGTINTKENFYCDQNNQLKLNVIFDESMVAQRKFIEIRVISNKAWHKYGTYDHKVDVTFSVLPPMQF